MKHHAYMFEAHSIQRYILDSGRLGEMVGASELIESLTTEGGLFDQALEELALKEPLTSKRAGGSITAFFNSVDEACQLRDLWGLLIQQYAPGLSFSHVVISANTEAQAAERGRYALADQRNTPFAAHPSGSPVTRRSPRTGLPATDTGTDFDEGGTSKKVREWVDRASHMKSAGRFRKSRNLSDRFGASEGMRWPTLLDPEDADKGTGSRNLGDPFPFLPDNRYVGILHADGNDLGLLLEELRERSNADNQDSYKDLFRAFSQAMSEATQAAAQDASAILIAAVADEDRPNFQGIYPARPLILGGDDLTIIVRADCALDYAEQFIQAFNQHTQVAFQGLRSGPHGETFSFLPESGMSACAGIAFIKSTQPFYLAYDLAEGLCDHAKKSSRDQSGTKHSALAFARVTTSFIPRYQDLLDDELSIRDASDALYRTTLGAYAVGLPADIDLPPLSALRELKDLLARPDMSRGPARQLLSLLHYSPNEAERTYQRWQDNLKDADRDRHQKRWQKFSAALQALGINPEASLPYRSRQGHIPDTPLGDALAWLAVDGSTEANDHD